jgi:uncharacterized Fe-S cluster protein YjdI
MTLMKVSSMQLGNMMSNKISNGNKIVVLYRLNNCIHCDNFMKTLQELFMKNPMYKNMCDMFDVEYNDFKYLEPRFTNGIHAFPRFILYHNNQIAKEFTEPRTQENISRFLISSSSKPSSSYSLSSPSSISRRNKSKTTKVIKHTKKYSKSS